MEECLVYFRKAVSDPQSVPPWSEWWAEHETVVERSFSLVDYVRLKHRKLKGARQILQLAGELTKDFTPPSALATGSCSECGERIRGAAIPSETREITCTACGILFIDDSPSQV